MASRTRWALLTILGVAVAVAIGPSVAQEGVTASPSEKKAAALPSPLVIPKDASARRNPQPMTSENLSEGRKLFVSQCAMCHGAEGAGDGDLVPRLKMSIPDYQDPKVQATRTDGDLMYIMTTGHGVMPGEKQLSETSRWNIVLYLRSLAKG